MAARTQLGPVEGPIPVEVHTQAQLVAVLGGEEQRAVEGDCLPQVWCAVVW